MWYTTLRITHTAVKQKTLLLIVGLAAGATVFVLSGLAILTQSGNLGLLRTQVGTDQPAEEEGTPEIIEQLEEGTETQPALPPPEIPSAEAAILGAFLENPDTWIDDQAREGQKILDELKAVNTAAKTLLQQTMSDIVGVMEESIPEVQSPGQSSSETPQ